jgi:hypothetical protein
MVAATLAARRGLVREAPSVIPPDAA